MLARPVYVILLGLPFISSLPCIHGFVYTITFAINALRGRYWTSQVSSLCQVSQPCTLWLLFLFLFLLVLGPRAEDGKRASSCYSTSWRYLARGPLSISSTERWAPAVLRSCAQSSLPDSVARKRGELSALLRSCTLAPRLRSSSMISELPDTAARCTAVLPA